MQKLYQILALLALTALLAACGGDKLEKYATMTDRQIYGEAVTALKDENYETATTAYQQLDAQYPFGPFSEQGQLEIIYAYFKLDELPASLASADRFIRLHPRHPNIDYAYYMRGLVKFSENISLIDRFLPIERGLRDLSAPRESYNYFAELTRLYPDSPYSVDARQRMKFIRNVLAENELAAARWYMKRKAYLAAANRASYVIEHYPESPEVPPALALLAEAYEEMGLDDLAKSTEKLLHDNYGEVEWEDD